MEPNSPIERQEDAPDRSPAIAAIVDGVDSSKPQSDSINLPIDRTDGVPNGDSDTAKTGGESVAVDNANTPHPPAEDTANPTEHTNPANSKDRNVKPPISLLKGADSTDAAVNKGVAAGDEADIAKPASALNPSEKPPAAKDATEKSTSEESATSTTNDGADVIVTKKPPYWFAPTFYKIFSQTEEDPLTDLNFVVVQLLRQDAVDESSSGSSGGKKKKKKKKPTNGKKQKGKRPAKPEEIPATKRQRKTLRTLDLDDFMDDEDFGDIIIKGDNQKDEEDAKVPAVATKRPPAKKKKDEDDDHSDDEYVLEEVIDESDASSTMSLSEFLSKSQAEIQSAASLVSRSLLFGLWPSPYRSLEPARIFHRQLSEYSAHREHMSMVGVAIETFSNDIISQAIKEEIQHCPKEKRSEPRAYLATLLYLRELLVLNAATIFGPSAFLTGLEADFTTFRSKYDTGMPVRDAAMLTVRFLATAVIVDGLSQLGIEHGEASLAEELTAAFLDMVEKYELGDSEFSGCLTRITNNVVPFYPSRQRMPEKERRLWMASMNFQREHHPLVSMQPSTTVPEPNAVHVSMIQSVVAAKGDESMDQSLLQKKR